MRMSVSCLIYYFTLIYYIISSSEIQETIYYQDECYLIIDQFAVFEKGSLCYKRLQEKNTSGEIITIAKLLPNEGQSCSANYSKSFQVANNVLLSPYTRVMTTAPFLTKTLTKENDANILMIGLGGSSINNFLAGFSENYNITAIDLNPAMKLISTRWFGLKETAQHHVLIEDGAKYLERNLGAPKFDAILIDACYNKVVDELFCPVPVFQEEINIRNIRDNLKDNGTLTMNVLILKSNAKRREILRNVLTCANMNFTLTSTEEYYDHYNNSVPASIRNVLFERIEIENF